MPQVHRNGDARLCGATTNAQAHMNVYINGQPISVDGDPNSHGGGSLGARCKNFYVGGKLVVLNGNPAGADTLALFHHIVVQTLVLEVLILT